MITTPATRRSTLAFLAAFGSTNAFAQQVDASQVVHELADLVGTEYPEPRAAAQLARTLRASARAGRYVGLSNSSLAERLTSHLRAAIADQHLSVRFDPQDAADRTHFSRVPPTPEPPIPRTPSSRAREVFEPQNYGLAAVRRLPGNIGLIAIDNFAPLYDVVRARYGAAMSLLADTFGMIIDLRDNGGGHPSSASYLMSYLFDRDPFVLDRMVWRRLPTEENRTTRDLVGVSYGESRPVAVAISRETFSAAEAVAYDLQAYERAQVVGEVSRGGANPGDFFNLGQGFVAFVPQGRAVNARTNGNWEGTGVHPDVAAEGSAILPAAHRAVIEAALARTMDQQRRDILQNAIGATLGS